MVLVYRPSDFRANYLTIFDCHSLYTMWFTIFVVRNISLCGLCPVSLSETKLRPVSGPSMSFTPLRVERHRSCHIVAVLQFSLQTRTVDYGPKLMIPNVIYCGVDGIELTERSYLSNQIFISVYFTFLLLMTTFRKLMACTAKKF